MAEVKEIIDTLDSRMSKSLSHLQEQLQNVRAGKASAGILNGILVESYGSEVPIDQVASITVPDAKNVMIQPWDKTMIAKIEKAIMNANIGVTPSSNGDQIRLTLPPMTEDRRKQLAKQVKVETENAKITLRGLRRDAVDSLKKAQKDGMPEDMAKDGEGEAQKLTDKYSKMIDSELIAKEKEIMTV